ncbi:MAG: hypothetical protein A3A80_03885 [Candidatus Terrybacteria bacterium RIFCSPLOWO2_01_FULL_44_24]|nr:MAG: hypothetical protein A3B75_01470 [Candidatus Terrybacteria bacterium RIFCSPHIGHO2_02_FULL_43_14]OHA51213.1 MAG: hypothetical protein A3A80_03885 [Candidatus Terrybacteria bacterium RIFCSPLOWO2_01_FULL_44_24]
MVKKEWIKNNLALLIICAATIIVAVFFLIIETANAGRIIRGVSLDGRVLGGLTRQQAFEKLGADVESYLNTPIGIMTGGSPAPTTTPKQLGVEIDTMQEIEKLYAFGRRTNIFIGLVEQVLGYFGKINIVLEPKINEQVFEDSTNELFSGLEQPARDAAIVYNEELGQYTIINEKSGYLISRSQLRSMLLARAKILSAAKIEVSQENAEPKIRASALNNAKDQTDKLLASAPYALTYKDKSWPADKSVIIDWIIFLPLEPDTENAGLTTSVSPIAVEDYLLRNIAHEINIDPQNAELTVKDGRVNFFKPSRDGLELDAEKSSVNISSQVLEGKQEVALTVKETPPDITTESVNDLGIKELLAVGESSFIGSPKNRISNIKTGAAKFNGILIKPGEEFSFDDTLGPVTAETGYKPELVIKQNKTVPEFGGGLCQVSTTMFRAAVYAGLQVTERYPHAYPVKYYGTPGFDATIYPPNPDLKFINDTPGHILVQTKISGSTLIFEFYGTSDGRKTEVKGPIVTKKGADGSAEAYVKQTVTRDEETIREKTFFSKYRSPKLYPVENRNPLE